jgi:hypothetical protein
MHHLATSLTIARKSSSFYKQFPVFSRLDCIPAHSNSFKSAKMYDTESNFTIVVLLILIAVYLYILISPGQPHLSAQLQRFVIPEDTKEQFTSFTSNTNVYSTSSWTYGKYDDNITAGGASKEWGAAGRRDDFFFDPSFGSVSSEVHEAIKPSEEFSCFAGWVSIRSEMNYKYLWMHTGESMWMGATATMDTPVHHKAFRTTPVDDSCTGGWILMQEGDNDGYLTMIPPSATSFTSDAWVVKVASADISIAKNDTSYHFLLESAGYILNRGSMAFVNVMPESEYSVRGHSSGWDRNQPAAREYGTMMHFAFVNQSDVDAAIAEENREISDALHQDEDLLRQIKQFPTSLEKRVISFGLYGGKPKYTTGAIRNAELAKDYFPGWVCRFYVTSDVPLPVLEKLKSLGSEILNIPPGKGYISGMFWRFLVAADDSVDRYIIRDADSRLNARDR